MTPSQITDCAEELCEYFRKPPFLPCTFQVERILTKHNTMPEQPKDQPSTLERLGHTKEKLKQFEEQFSGDQPSPGKSLDEIAAQSERDQLKAEVEELRKRLTQSNRNLESERQHHMENVLQRDLFARRLKTLARMVSFIGRNDHHFWSKFNRVEDAADAVLANNFAALDAENKKGEK